MVGMWSLAGGSAEHRPIGYWWAAAPKSRWPDDDEVWKAIMKDWEEPYGDRRQQLVYIGQELPKETMIAALDACLLTDDELELGPETWTLFSDPFPEWIDSREGDSP